MADNDTLLWILTGTPTTAGAAVGGWVLVRKYGKELWKRRYHFEKAVELVTGPDEHEGERPAPHGPPEPVAPNLLEAEADAAVLEQLRALREHAVWSRDHATWTTGELRRLEGMVTARNTRIDELEAELARLLAENAQLHLEKVQLQAEREQLRLEAEARTARIVQVELELAQLRSDAAGAFGAAGAGLTEHTDV